MRKSHYEIAKAQRKAAQAREIDEQTALWALWSTWGIVLGAIVLLVLHFLVGV